MHQDRFLLEDRLVLGGGVYSPAFILRNFFLNPAATAVVFAGEGRHTPFPQSPRYLAEPEVSQTRRSQKPALAHSRRQRLYNGYVPVSRARVCAKRRTPMFHTRAG